MNDKVKILHLRQAVGGGGGADTVLLDILRLVNANFFQCTAVYLVKQGKNVDPLALAFKKNGLMLTQLSGRAWLDPVQLLELHRLIRLEKIRILHCHDSKTRLFGCLLKVFNPHLQLVATLHGWIPRRTRSRFYIALDKLLLRFFNVNIAVSAEIQQEAINVKGSHVVLLRNGVDTSLWKKGSEATRESDVLKIGFVGRLSKEKGIYEFIRIAALVAGQIPGCIFWIAGEGPEKKNIQQLVHELDVEKKVLLLGLQNRIELMRIYHQLDVLLLPSHYEGVPLTMLEAMSMGIPVVATRVGGMAEVLEGTDGGLLAEPGNLEKMAEHVLRLLRNRELAETLGRNARKLVQEQYDLAARVRTLEKYYQQVAGK